MQCLKGSFGKCFEYGLFCFVLFPVLFIVNFVMCQAEENMTNFEGYSGRIKPQEEATITENKL